MSVTFRSAATAGADVVANQAVTKPAGTAEDDFLLAICVIAHDDAATTITSTGWSTAPGGSLSAANNGPRFAVLYKAAGASEASSYTFTKNGGTNSQLIVHAHAYPGVDLTDPFAANVTAAAGTTAAAVVAPSVTAVDDSLAVYAWAAEKFNATPNLYGFTPPASPVFERSDFGNLYDYLAIATEQRNGAAATGTRTATFILRSTSASTTSDDSAGISFVLRAAPTGPIEKDAADSGTRTETVTVTAQATAADTGTGTDSASIAVPRAAADSAVATDAAFAGIPVPANDTSSAAEQVSTTAALSALDPRTGTDTAGVVAALNAGTNTATGTDSAIIGIPVHDSGAGQPEHISLLGRLGINEGGSGSDGATVETLFGDLNISLWGIHPDTGASIALPDYTSLTLSPERNSAGSITVTYPAEGLNFALLRDTVTADRDLEVEIWSIGSPVGALRGYLQEATGDDVVEGKVWTFAGGFLELRMSEAVVWPQPMGPLVPDDDDDPDNDQHANEKQELVFSAVTAGDIAATILAQAQHRGGLTDITAGFTGDVDSDGTPWPNVVSTKFSPGAGYDQILGKLVDLGLAEWAIQWTGTEKVLKLWVPEGRGTDLTVGNRPVVLRRGRNLLEASRKWSVRASGTAVLAAGAEGVYESASDATALARRGRRIEVAASANNISDDATVLAYAQQQLAITTPGLLEVTHGLGFLPGEPRPLIAFDVGDWVYSQTGTTLDRLRIVQWTLTVDAEQNPSGGVTLNDSVTDNLVRLQRRLNALTAGETVVGTSTASTFEDATPPKAPTGLVASSIAYQDDVDSETYASVTVGWDAVTEDILGVAETVAGYRVRYAYVGLNQVGGIPSSDPFPEDDLNYYEATDNTGTPNTTFSFGGVGAGADVRVEVRAFDQAGNEGDWSAPLTFTTEIDNTPPPVTSPPTLVAWFGTVNITWDGLGSAGEVMPVDFDHVEVHLSTANAFTPTSATFKANLYAGGTWNVPDLPYGVSQYARLVAVDRTGNASAPSATSSPATPEQLVSADLIDDIIDATKLGPNSVESQHVVNAAITSAKILDAAIVTAKIADLAVNTAKIADLDVGRLTTGTLFATVTLSGIIRTNTTGARSEIDAAGIRLYNSAGSLTVRLQTSDGSALVTGTYQSALSGERINILPDGTFRFYPSAGSNYSQIANFGNDVVWRGPLDANNRSGRVNVNVLGVGLNFSAETEIPNNLRSEMIVTDRQARTTAPLIVLELNGKLTVPAGSNRRLELRTTNSSGTVLTASLLYYTARSGDNLATWGGNNSGFVFDSKVVVTTGNATTFGAIGASSFDPPSSGTVKDNIADARAALDPLDTIRNARSKRWNYAWEHYTTPPAADEDPNPEPVPVEAPVRFGPIAEDLPPVLVTDVTMPDGSGTVPGASLGSLIGVLWGALGQVLDQRLVQTTADVPLPSRLNANTDYDVTVPWAEGEAQTVPVPVSLTPMGPTNLQLRALSAQVVAITKAGVTVRFRAKRLIIGLDVEDHYVATAVHSFIPPYVPEEEAS